MLKDEMIKAILEILQNAEMREVDLVFRFIKSLKS